MTDEWHCVCPTGLTLERLTRGDEEICEGELKCSLVAELGELERGMVRQSVVDKRWRRME